jgi:ribonuclease HI
VQVTALRRYVRKTRDIRVAELLSLAFDAAVNGDADAAGRHVAAAELLAGETCAGWALGGQAGNSQADSGQAGSSRPGNGLVHGVRQPTGIGQAGPRAAPPRIAVPGSRAATPTSASRRARAEPRRTATLIRKPLTGQARVTSAGPVLIATDGSSSGDGAHCSWAFIATSGYWGCQAGDYRHDNVNGGSGALIAELRAAYLALRCVAGPVTLLADSMIALRYLRAWQRGETGRMPPQYDLHPRHAGAAPALVTLADLVSARREELALAHVKGHAGHTLNEGADLLATVARRWVAAAETLSQTAMRAEAADIAATFLAQWHRENPQPHPPRP